MVFYLDASIPFPVSQAFALVRDDVLYPGGPGCPITTPDAKDHEWLPVAGQHGWVVLMRDKARAVAARRTPGATRERCPCVRAHRRWELLEVAHARPAGAALA